MASSEAVGTLPAAGVDPVHVRVRDLHFAREGRVVFQGLSCDLLRDRVNVVLGGSGSGKTTLLRMLGCLVRPDAGSLRVDDMEITALHGPELRHYRRCVGMMFQGGALLDSLSVFDNVALPLREHSPMSEAEIRAEVEDVFASVGLEGVSELMPAQLSGGMQKRAALARALIMAPDLLLCDEPFSGLDPATLRLVEDLLVDTNRRRRVTMVIASHDVPSTFRMADQIVLLMEGGALEGEPKTFEESTDPRVEHFFAGTRP